MTFIIHFKDGHRETYNNRYDEDVEHERDAAWDDVYATFPDAEYIMNLNPKELKYYNKVLDNWNDPKGIVFDAVKPKYSLEFKDFFIPLQDCIERDSKRPNPIGEEVIRKTYEKYKDILKV